MNQIVSYIKTLKWVDYIYYALTEPRMLSRRLAEHPSGFLPVTIVIVAAVCAVEILSLSILSSQSLFFHYKMTYGWILLSLMFGIWLIFYAGMTDLVLQFMGYNGNIKRILSIINISLFVRIFLLPLVFIFEVINFAPVFFYVLFFIVLCAWMVYIFAINIAEMYSLTFLKSLAVIAVPTAVFGAVCILQLVLSAALVGGLLEAL